MIYYNMKYIIYKIQINDYIYIGSTKRFAVRKSQHKRDCNNGMDLLVYNTIREHGGWESCTMVPVREVEVETILQAHIIEEEERLKYNAQMNAKRAYRTEEEGKALNSESAKLYSQSKEGKAKKKLWREANKEQLAEARKIWREANIEKANDASKKWREANKERIAEYDKKWREAKRAEQSSQPNV
jgi:hypothetical protein